MQTCIVPVISFNYAAKDIRRCQKTLWASVLFGAVFMAVGLIVFETLPAQMLSVFTSDPEVIRIGTVGFRFTGASFLPLVTSLIFPAFFQAVGASLKSTLLTVVRTVVCFVPLGYLFSRFGLTMFWMTYPVTEIVTTIVGLVCYRQFLNSDYVRSAGQPPLLEAGELALKPSKPGVIVTIARQHGSSGKQIGKMAAKKLGIPFYYKEMIALAAHESGLDRDFISNIHKNSPDVLRGLYLSSHAVRRAMLAQDKIIRKIAEEGSCVIVGPRRRPCAERSSQRRQSVHRRARGVPHLARQRGVRRHLTGGKAQPAPFGQGARGVLPPPFGQALGRPSELRSRARLLRGLGNCRRNPRRLRKGERACALPSSRHAAESASRRGRSANTAIRQSKSAGGSLRFLLKGRRPRL